MPPAQAVEDLLPILAVSSNNYKHVFKFWESSLEMLDYPLDKRNVRDLGELKPPFGYCTDSWREAIDEQLREVVKWIQDHMGSIFLHTDTDIQFFPRFVQVQHEWQQFMRKSRLDMLFMRERTHLFQEMREGEVNGGFYIIQCNQRTLAFWSKVLNCELAYPKMDGIPPYTDQYHINKSLCYKRGACPQVGEFGVRWSIIPDVHCIWSEPTSDEELLQAAFHHAVNTDAKTKLLKRVREQALQWQGVAALRLPSVQCHPEGQSGDQFRVPCNSCKEVEGSWRELWWCTTDGSGYCMRCWASWHQALRDDMWLVAD